jgi:parvulin-like peptidyl-prolyl isomerase
MTSRFFRGALALAAGAALVVAAAGCGTSDISADAATVSNLGKGSDDVHINRSDFEDELQKLIESDDFRRLLEQNDIAANKENVDARIAASWLSQRITQAAIDAEFEARGLKVSEANRELGRRQAAQQLGGEQVGAQVLGSLPKAFQKDLIEGAARFAAVFDSYAKHPSEAAARAYYEENRDQFDCASGKEVAHILVADAARANDLMTQLRAGASFASLAEQFSTDTGSAQQGGKLGCLTSGAYVPEFQSAAESAPPGTPVGPVKTQFGEHIILVTPFENSFQAAQAQIVAALQQQGQQKAQEAILKRLERMKVKVDPRYGKWGEVDDGQGGTSRQVIPPKSVDVRDGRAPTTTTTPANGQGESP